MFERERAAQHGGAPGWVAVAEAGCAGAVEDDQMMQSCQVSCERLLADETDLEPAFDATGRMALPADQLTHLAAVGAGPGQFELFSNGSTVAMTGQRQRPGAPIGRADQAQSQDRVIEQSERQKSILAELAMCEERMDALRSKMSKLEASALGKRGKREKDALQRKIDKLGKHTDKLEELVQLSARARSASVVCAPEPIGTSQSGNSKAKVAPAPAPKAAKDVQGKTKATPEAAPKSGKNDSGKAKAAPAPEAAPKTRKDVQGKTKGAPAPEPASKSGKEAQGKTKGAPEPASKSGKEAQGKTKGAPEPAPKSGKEAQGKTKGAPEPAPKSGKNGQGKTKPLPEPSPKTKAAPEPTQCSGKTGQGKTKPLQDPVPKNAAEEEEMLRKAIEASKREASYNPGKPRKTKLASLTRQEACELDWLALSHWSTRSMLKGMQVLKQERWANWLSSLVSWQNMLSELSCSRLMADALRAWVRNWAVDAPRNLLDKPREAQDEKQTCKVKSKPGKKKRTLQSDESNKTPGAAAGPELPPELHTVVCKEPAEETAQFESEPEDVQAKFDCPTCGTEQMCNILCMNGMNTGVEKSLCIICPVCESKLAHDVEHAMDEELAGMNLTDQHLQKLKKDANQLYERAGCFGKQGLTSKRSLKRVMQHSCNLKHKLVNNGWKAFFAECELTDKDGAQPCTSCVIILAGRETGIIDPHRFITSYVVKIGQCLLRGLGQDPEVKSKMRKQEKQKRASNAEQCSTARQMVASNTELQHESNVRKQVPDEDAPMVEGTVPKGFREGSEMVLESDGALYTLPPWVSTVPGTVFRVRKDELTPYEPDKSQIYRIMNANGESYRPAWLDPQNVQLGVEPALDSATALEDAEAGGSSKGLSKHDREKEALKAQTKEEVKNDRKKEALRAKIVEDVKKARELQKSEAARNNPSEQNIRALVKFHVSRLNSFETVIDILGLRGKVTAPQLNDWINFKDFELDTLITTRVKKTPFASVETYKALDAEMEAAYVEARIQRDRHPKPAEQARPTASEAATQFDMDEKACPICRRLLSTPLLRRYHEKVCKPAKPVEAVRQETPQQLESVAVVCTVSGLMACNVDTLVWHYTTLNVSKIYLYLDDQEVSDGLKMALETLSRTQSVAEVVPIDEAPKAHDPDVRSRLYAEHALGLAKAAGIDWLLQIDCNELLWLPEEFDDARCFFSYLSSHKIAMYTFKTLRGIPVSPTAAASLTSLALQDGNHIIDPFLEVNQFGAVSGCCQHNSLWDTKPPSHVPLGRVAVRTQHANRMLWYEMWELVDADGVPLDPSHYNAKSKNLLWQNNSNMSTKSITGRQHEVFGSEELKHYRSIDQVHHLDDGIVAKASILCFRDCDFASFWMKRRGYSRLLCPETEQGQTPGAQQGQTPDMHGGVRVPPQDSKVITVAFERERDAHRLFQQRIDMERQGPVYTIDLGRLREPHPAVFDTKTLAFSALESSHCAEAAYFFAREARKATRRNELYALWLSRASSAIKAHLYTASVQAAECAIVCALGMSDEVSQRCRVDALLIKSIALATLGLSTSAEKTKQAALDSCQGELSPSQQALISARDKTATKWSEYNYRFRSEENELIRQGQRKELMQEWSSNELEAHA